MNKVILISILIIILVILASGLVYLIKSYQGAQIDQVRHYKNDIEGEAYEQISGSVEERNKMIQEQLGQ